MNIRDWWKIEQSKDASLPNEIPEIIMRAWMTGEEFGRDRVVKFCDERLDNLGINGLITEYLPWQAINAYKKVKHFATHPDDPKNFV